MKLQNLALSLIWAGIGMAQVTIPDGTKLRVRLDQALSSATAEEGQAVELSVAEAVTIDNVVVIKDGTRVTGTITEAEPKRRMGRAGKLDFSIDRVAASDGQWVPLRYSLQKKSGNSHVVRTGIITAGVAFAFLPAAPVMLLMKGKDIDINKGQTFEVFTDRPHAFGAPVAAGQATRASVAAPAAPPTSSSLVPQSPAAPAVSPGGGPASITVTASAPGADIEVNGAFVGNTPTTLQLQPGSHHIVVKSGSQTWGRTVQVTGGSTVSLHAILTHSGVSASTR